MKRVRFIKVYISCQFDMSRTYIMISVEKYHDIRRACHGGGNWGGGFRDCAALCGAQVKVYVWCTGKFWNCSNWIHLNRCKNISKITTIICTPGPTPPTIPTTSPVSSAPAAVWQRELMALEMLWLNHWGMFGRWKYFLRLDLNDKA